MAFPPDAAAAPDLRGKVAVVAGVTRGAGRGISCKLGRAGATGRSVRGSAVRPGRPETVEETAEMVSERSGIGPWQRVDHTAPEQVRGLFERE